MSDEEDVTRRRQRRSVLTRVAVATVGVGTLIGVGLIATNGGNGRDEQTISHPSTSSAGKSPTTVAPPATSPTRPAYTGLRTLPWISTVIEPGTRNPFQRTLDATGVRRAPDCWLGDLRVVASIGGAGGADYAGIRVRNQGSRPCSVHGSPYVEFLDSAGHVVGEYSAHAAASDPVVVLVPRSWAAVGLIGVGADHCGGPNNDERGGTTAAAIVFGIFAGDTRVVHPAPDYGFDPNGCPVSVAPGSHTGAFAAISTPSGNDPLYEPLRSGMTLDPPRQVRRGEIASYSVTFTNRSSNTFPLVDDCPLYRQSIGDAGSGPLLLDCNGSGGVLVAPGASVRFEMRLAVPAKQPLGATMLRWQFIEPEEPALTAPVTVIETTGSLDLHTVDWKNIAAPGRSCLHAGDIQLHNGEALLPDNVRGNPMTPESNGPRYDALYKGRVSYGDLEGDGHDDAFVPLDCTNNGGTADGLILDSFAVYSGRGAKLTYLGLITPQYQPKDVLPTRTSIAAVTPGTVTVHEFFYGPNDSTCCSSGKAVTKWSLSPGGLVPASPSVTATPKK